VRNQMLIGARQMVSMQLMAVRTPIEWTHATWNPTTGSVTASIGIKNPSAEQDLEHLPPERQGWSIMEKRTFCIMSETEAEPSKSRPLMSGRGRR
jgi:hypothetical protein